MIAQFKSNKSDKSNTSKKIGGVALLGGSAAIGTQTIRSGVPRALGVRLESHNTSRKNAKAILDNGGYLDPNYGGTGASKAINENEFIRKSKNSIHITGTHVKGNSLNSPILDNLYRKVQRGMYRGITGENFTMDDTKKIMKLQLAGLTGLKGKSLYVGGSDKYFKNNFKPDEDDIALKSFKKLKVFDSRFAATKDTLNRYGKGNYVKGAARLMGANKGRVLTGLGILGVGGTAAGLLGVKGVKLLQSDKPRNRRSKVKSYVRKGKLVKTFDRLNPFYNKTSKSK